MHIIQRHILKELTLKQKARYKDLKPKEIEGNQFMYHLGVAIDLGYVIKRGQFYELTHPGKIYSDRVTLENFLPHEQPKIVSMLYCTNKKGEVLLFRRTRSPLFNLVHLPYGKIHMGEKVHDAATRELKEKAGLSAKLSHIGDVYTRVYDGDELIVHVLHHVFSGKDPEGKLLDTMPVGVPFWSKIADVPKNEIVGGFKEIVDMIKKNKGKFFFEEFDLYLPKSNPQT